MRRGEVRQLLALLVLLAVGLVGAPLRATSQSTGSAIDVDEVPAVADPARRLQRLVNAERAAAGLRPVRWNDTLELVATDWTGRMAAATELSHRPDLADVVTSGWRRIGENVGVGTEVDQLHLAFMASPGHRRNVLGAYDQVGIAVVRQGARLWVTVNLGSGEITRTTVRPLAATGAGTGSRFADVPADGVHRRGIEALTGAGVSGGCGDGRFCPGRLVTRAQMATFVHNAAGLPSGAGSTLGDVPDGSPHDRTIAAVTDAGLMPPCATGRFCPAAPVDRAEMAGILVRLLGLDAAAGATRFADVTDPRLAAEVEAIAVAGVTRGCGGELFCPEGTVTRAEMATFLTAALRLG